MKVSFINVSHMVFYDFFNTPIWCFLFSVVPSWLFCCRCVTSSTLLLADSSKFHGLDEFIFSTDFFSIPQYGSFLISMVHHWLFGYRRVVGGFLQVSSFRWIHLFNEFTYFTAFWCCPAFHGLNEFIVFVDCFDEFTFYMNSYISENSMCVFNEFIYSVFISFNKWIHI